MRELKDRILRFMADEESDGFLPLALEVFRHQWDRNAPYRAVLEQRGVDPEAVAATVEAAVGAPESAAPEPLAPEPATTKPAATEPAATKAVATESAAVAALPAVSTVAFKTLRFSCGTPSIVFRTSGTTRGADRRGEHHLVDADLYQESLRRSFQAFVLPEMSTGKPSHNLDFLVLAPSAIWAPDSSLGFMMDEVTRAFGGAGSRFLLGPAGLDRDGAFEALARSEATGRPVLLLGTAFALVHLLDAMAEVGLERRLPPGSRVMDTGGFKGRGREVSRPELLAAYERRLGIPKTAVVNEYGMTELGSQFYDATLLGGDSEVKLGPHWVRTLVIDPATGQVAAPGQPGLLRHIDLANLDSVMAVETEDLGIARGRGFILLGRAAGAELRGCSLAAEELPGGARS